MQRVKLDTAPLAVKNFIRTLPIDPDGIELELDGQVICKIVGPSQLSQAERDALLEEGWKQVRQAQRRNKSVPAQTIKREIQQAVDEVRRRPRR